MPSGARGAYATAFLTDVEASFNEANSVVQAVSATSGVWPRQTPRLPYAPTDGRFVSGMSPAGNMVLCEERFGSFYAYHLRGFGEHFGGQFVSLLQDADTIATEHLNLPQASAAVQLVTALLREEAAPVSALFCDFEAAVQSHLRQLLDVGGGGDDGVEYEPVGAEACRAESLAAMTSLETVIEDMITDIRADITRMNIEAGTQRGLAARTPSFGANPTAADIAADNDARTRATARAGELDGQALLRQGDINTLQAAAQTLATARITCSTRFDTLTAEITAIDQTMATEMNAIADEMNTHLTRMQQIENSFNPNTGTLDFGVLEPMVRALPAGRARLLLGLLQEARVESLVAAMMDGEAGVALIESILGRDVENISPEEWMALAIALPQLRVDGEGRPCVEVWNRAIAAMMRDHPVEWGAPMFSELSMPHLEQLMLWLEIACERNRTIGFDAEQAGNIVQLLAALGMVAETPMIAIEADVDGGRIPFSPLAIQPDGSINISFKTVWFNADRLCNTWASVAPGNWHMVDGWVSSPINPTVGGMQVHNAWRELMKQIYEGRYGTPIGNPPIWLATVSFVWSMGWAVAPIDLPGFIDGGIAIATYAGDILGGMGEANEANRQRIENWNRSLRELDYGSAGNIADTYGLTTVITRNNDRPEAVSRPGQHAQTEMGRRPADGDNARDDRGGVARRVQDVMTNDPDFLRRVSDRIGGPVPALCPEGRLRADDLARNPVLFVEILAELENLRAQQN